MHRQTIKGGGTPKTATNIMTKNQLFEICKAAYIACAKMVVIYKDGSNTLITTAYWDYIAIGEQITFKRYLDDTKRILNHTDIEQINIILP